MWVYGCYAYNCSRTIFTTGNKNLLHKQVVTTCSNLRRRICILNRDNEDRSGFQIKPKRSWRSSSDVLRILKRADRNGKFKLKPKIWTRTTENRQTTAWLSTCAHCRIGERWIGNGTQNDAAVANDSAIEEAILESFPLNGAVLCQQPIAIPLRERWRTEKEGSRRWRGRAAHQEASTTTFGWDKENSAVDIGAG